MKAGRARTGAKDGSPLLLLLVRWRAASVAIHLRALVAASMTNCWCWHGSGSNSGDILALCYHSTITLAIARFPATKQEATLARDVGHFHTNQTMHLYLAKVGSIGFNSIGVFSSLLFLPRYRTRYRCRFQCQKNLLDHLQSWPISFLLPSSTPLANLNLAQRPKLNLIWFHSQSNQTKLNSLVAVRSSCQFRALILELQLAH